MTLRRNDEAVFTADMIKRWKAVPARTTGQAASACHRGVDYTGSNKMDIYRSFAKLNSHGSQKPPQIHQFIPLMDAIAKTFNHHNNLIQQEIGGLIKLYTTKQ